MEYPIRSFVKFKLESESNELIAPAIEASTIQYRKDILKMVTHAYRTKQIKANVNAEALSFQINGIIEGMILNHTIVRTNAKAILLDKYEAIFQELFNSICSNVSAN
jgi:hypothetical protein